MVRSNCNPTGDSLFFLSRHFAGTREADSPGDGEHSGAPADVKSFPDFIPASKLSVRQQPLECPSPKIPVGSLPYPRIERVKEILRDVEGIPGHRHHGAQTFGENHFLWLRKQHIKFMKARL